MEANFIVLEEFVDLQHLTELPVSHVEDLLVASSDQCGFIIECLSIGFHGDRSGDQTTRLLSRARRGFRPSTDVRLLLQTSASVVPA